MRTIRTIRVSDLLMHDDLSVEELVKEFCQADDFTLVDFEEYEDRYEEDGFQFAQVLIRVEDGE